MWGLVKICSYITTCNSSSERKILDRTLDVTVLALLMNYSTLSLLVHGHRVTPGVPLTELATTFFKGASWDN